VNITFWLRDGRHTRVVNADRRTVGAQVQYIVDRPSSGTRLANTQSGGQVGEFRNADVDRIEIDLT